jgi:hypothetical protein
MRCYGANLEQLKTCQAVLYATTRMNYGKSGCGKASQTSEEASFSNTIERLSPGRQALCSGCALELSNPSCWYCLRRVGYFTPCPEQGSCQLAYGDFR